MSVNVHRDGKRPYFPATTDSWSLMRPSPSNMVSRDSLLSSTVSAETESPPADESSIWKGNGFHFKSTRSHLSRRITRLHLTRVTDEAEAHLFFTHLELNQAGRNGHTTDGV